MKRINGAVEFEFDLGRARLSDEGLEWYDNYIQDWVKMDVGGCQWFFAIEDGRALLAEAIEVLDHPYRGINVNIPPHMRATPRGNK